MLPGCSFARVFLYPPCVMTVLIFLLVSVPFQSWEERLPTSQCSPGWDPGSTEQPYVENWESLWPVLVHACRRLQHLALRHQYQAAVAGRDHPTGSRSTACRHQLAPLPAPPHLLDEGDTRRGWEKLAGSQPYNMCAPMLNLSWENKEGLCWKGTSLSPGKEQGKVPFPAPFLDQLTLGFCPWGMELTYLSLNFLIWVKDRENHNRKSCCQYQANKIKVHFPNSYLPRAWWMRCVVCCRWRIKGWR